MKHTERTAIEELAQLLDGELPADDAAAPLRRLAGLAATIGATETLERPSPAARAALRNQLVADIEASKVTPLDRARDAVWHRTAGLRHSAKVAVASALASGMLGSAGVAAAAQHALPGDALYGVKRATESVRMSLASGALEEAQVQLALAEERLSELQAEPDRLASDEVVDTLERMDDASLTATGTLVQAVADGADVSLLDDLVSFTARQRQGLVDVYDDLPIDTRPFADASLEVLRRIEVEVATTVGPCQVCEQIASGADVTAVTPGDGIGARDCDCIPSDVPPPPRDPGVSVPAPSASATDAPDEPQATTPAGPSDRERPDVVPPLPDPLDGIGDAVDDLLGDVVEEAPTLPAAPSEVTGAVGDLTGTVGEVVEDLGGLLEPTDP